MLFTLYTKSRPVIYGFYTANIFHSYEPDRASFFRKQKQLKQKSFVTHGNKSKKKNTRLCVQ